MKQFSEKQTYTNTYERFLKTMPRDQAMRAAVGGKRSLEIYDVIGQIEVDLLRAHGLAPEQHLVDVGCGSGRLAQALAKDHSGKYSGYDVVQVAVEYAREVVNRPDWRFEEISSIAIPEPDHSCDMVCFFSVFTHLLPEQCYDYLQECRRVLKPGGKIVFSFLERGRLRHFKMVVYGVLKRIINRRENHINIFISKKKIEQWAQELGLTLVQFHDTTEKVSPIGALGQSVCVLAVPAAAE